MSHRLRKKKSSDRRRDRTCNLLIRSQAPCHWASRPCCYEILAQMCTLSEAEYGPAFEQASMHLIGAFILPTYVCVEKSHILSLLLTSWEGI
ncbi:hypothetical protein VN97_g5237 [Penicillium thymicola]|uniref:Uncharacterized protein n=1 Tax=Penicillium thymicola TaxID=293382 RepID=A0AAI9TIT7_PENTH|nr:hypothetical protein VN97_g5237 [Penicillium thymicola]